MNLKKEYLHNFCYQKYFFIYYNENLFLTNVYIYKNAIANYNLFNN